MLIYLLTTITVLDIFLEINQDISSFESTSVLVQHKTARTLAWLIDIMYASSTLYMYKFFCTNHVAKLEAYILHPLVYSWFVLGSNKVFHKECMESSWT
jgi:hypothetical protein